VALAQDVDLRIKAPGHLVGTRQQLLQPTLKSRSKVGRDPGARCGGNSKGQIVVVQVLSEGFQYQDHFYRSLSAIACQATGSAWNGFDFFRQRKLVFAGKLLPLAHPKAFSSFLRPLFRKDWIVYAKAPFGGPHHAVSEVRNSHAAD
jgi:hypothetical protein